MQWLIDIIKEWIEAEGYLLTAYIDRGDPASFDWHDDDFEIDGNWNELDMSDIVPANAKAVVFRLFMLNSSVGKRISFRRAGNTNEGAIHTITSQVAEVTRSATLIVSLSNDRKIEYNLDTLGWEFVQLTITGWIF